MIEEQSNRPKLSDTLEKELEKYLSENIEFDRAGSAMDKWNKGCHLNRNDLEDIACHFADWQKEQMMKDAVEGTVHNFSSNKPHPTVLVDAKGFNQGDKVRIIIVKEDKR